MKLLGKTAIVTGGSSGIGEAIVRLFAAEGANVVIANRNGNDASRVIEQMQTKNGSIIAVQTDVSKDEDVRRLMLETVRQFGRIDVVVNNAAAIMPKYLEEVEEEEWDRIFNVNLKSVFLMIKHSIAELKKTRGSIVNMSSLNGLIGQKMNPVYAATKGGMNALTKALALDYAPYGVRVNSICPAGVTTPLLEQWISQQDDPVQTVRDLNAMHPLGRPATSEEVAQTALFLASDASGFVTGVALPVDGGASLGY
ncbi:SDR family NAD(P)-dependent oxidoreductase [Paenibacillus sp. JDR-2]|uniref:SDR family NAD(P)-dependent oxidoreductase n=1 Tax=Paenibacillus sp. (strain JDR-2) TaxID=324057 RepID=UPI000166BB31|nr:glucose 1-dehydrogenase [Paenibacillus sp. JDR-2]ACT01853.1 short-chain dehydrogenase/reductase SDR [Paenibacillus sp. JDR-2]